MTRREVAERAGVDLDYVDRLVDAGALVPAKDGAFETGTGCRSGSSEPS
jgi:hypothetical protein